ncbi:MAG: hypothetical protein LBV70_01915 [Candidatus Adiutrix sp.]|jgi:hypothetical protein|nr:hypothetical protein [Candidatus Adiutrix sp.]
MTETFKSAFDLAESGPGGLADFKILREEIFEIRRQVKTSFDQGLPPEALEPARGLLTACEIAETLADDLFGR